MEINRRSFLKLGTGAVATGTVAAVTPGVASAAPMNTSSTTLPYPKKPVGTVHQLSETKPMAFSYPDGASPCLAIKMGAAVPGGVGPNHDIVAYSTMCTHMGCPLATTPERRSSSARATSACSMPRRRARWCAAKRPKIFRGSILKYNDKDDRVTAVRHRRSALRPPIEHSVTARRRA